MLIHSTDKRIHEPSFRDMLQGQNRSSETSNQAENVDDEDDVSDDDVAPEEIMDDEQSPIILLTKEEKQRMRQPWKNSLIIKMFDGKIGYMGLMRKLKKKWSIKGELALTDIGFDYFIARFSNKADYNFNLFWLKGHG